MKRASSLDLLHDDFLADLWGDPKEVRREGGLQAVHELLTDSFLDPTADWSTLYVNAQQQSFAKPEQFTLEGSQELSSTSSTEVAKPEVLASQPVQSRSMGMFNQTVAGKPPLLPSPASIEDAMPASAPKKGRKTAKRAGDQTAHTSILSQHYRPSAAVTGTGNASAPYFCEEESCPGRGRARQDNANSSALAQRRYYQRQKAKKKDSQDKLSELTEQMEKLLADKKELEVKNRILLEDLDAWQAHLEAMWGQKGIRDIQQKLCLQATVDLIAAAEGQPICLEDSLKWTAHEYATVHYEKLVRHRQNLYRDAMSGGPNAEAAKKEMEALIYQEDDIDRKGGLSSCIHWGMMGYNRTMMKQNQPELPTEAHWEKVVDAVKLTSTQIDNILTCYQWMLDNLQRCAEERNEDILPQLGLEAGVLPRERMHQCPAAIALYHSFRTEQTAVMGFILMINRVLTYWQHAVLDVMSYPWSLEWLPICGILWKRRGRAPLALPEFEDRKLDLPVLPHLTAFEVLKMPVTMYGIGLRLRQGIIMCPFETVLSAKCFPLPEFDSPDKYKLIDIFLGRWRSLTCWEWMQKVRETGCLFKNEIADGEDWSKSSTCGVYYLGQDGMAVNNVPYLLYSARKTQVNERERHPLMQLPSASSGGSGSTGSVTRWFS